MKFKIIGINDEKIMIALKKLTKAFDRNCQFVDSEENILVFINSIIDKNEIYVVLKCKDETFAERIQFSNFDYDNKYLILAQFYRLLMKLYKKELSYGVLTGIRPTKLVHRYKKQYSDHEILNILQTKYLISKEKSKLLLTIVNNQLKIINFKDLEKELSIYINIPFCLSRCSYCSFTSYSTDYKFVSPSEYLEILMDEIKEISKYLKTNDITITTIYVGGGTPTALNEEELAKLLSCIETYLVNQFVREYTLECGRPDSLSLTKLRLIKKYSVTRISINPQTFNEETLKLINRKHSAKDIINTFIEARSLSFTNINMDLIIGLPNECISDFENSVVKIIALNPESITIHYLAQKRGSQIFNEEISSFYNFNPYQTLVDNEYIPYYLYRQKNIYGNLENIGYSKKGNESIYNIIMIEESQNIIGLGCNASSKYLNHEIILNPKDLISYMKSYRGYLKKKINMLEKCLMKAEENIDE